MKLREILGYDELGRPIRGYVVSPLRAPVSFRALGGAIRQDERGCILKPNHPYEDVGDDIRVTGFRLIRRDQIVTSVLAPAAQAAQPRAPLGRQELHQNLAAVMRSVAAKREAADAMTASVIDWEEEE
jgi:hypothetical protein